ncbi:MAG: hypothetical protein ACI9R3_003894 [Verrucomicrobiales bacterium]|jgi:hypothetical protein
MLGISEEQHGDRTHLFMQWQQMQWPVLIDSLNLLEVTAVPITLLIDAHGVIRFKNPKDSEVDSFLATDYGETPSPTPVTWSAELTQAIDAVYSGSPKMLDAALNTYQSMKDKTPRQWFHSGVLYRKRFDSSISREDDFSQAVAAWGKALAGDPGQYIWRRRIQQYGPRLDKPYPFYDWVPEARKTISARGETPAVLVAEPSGAEYAKPSSSSKDEPAPEDEKVHPDPQRKLPGDRENLISVSAVAVPSTDAKKKGWRVHLSFAPNAKKDVHWNNESGPIVVWWTPTSDWSPPASLQGSEITVDFAVPASATSEEVRRSEFELHQSPGGSVPEKIQGSAFIYVCEGATGTCQYLRKDFVVNVSRKL